MEEYIINNCIKFWKEITMNRETFIDENKTILNTDFYLHLLSCENENTNLKQALNEIKEVCENNAIEVNTREYGNLVVTNIDDILQIIDKVGGNE